MSVLVVDNVRKTYGSAETPVEALSGVSLVLDGGDFVAVMGPSGCGKSTLLHLCGAMDRPTAGRVLIEGQALAEMDDDGLTRLRRRRIGFVFQFFNLLPTLTVAENIALPLLLDGRPAAEADARSRRMADRVGLSHRLGHHPQQLSGGEMQRAAIARALVHEPALLLADEPTGNLDSDNGTRILELLTGLNADPGITLLLATHDDQIARRAGRVVQMRDGRVESVDVPRFSREVSSRASL